MSTAFVKLLGRTGLLNIKSTDKLDVEIDKKDLSCLLAKHGTVIKLGTTTVIDDGIIEANQTVIIYPGADLIPTTYHLFVGYNPELARNCKSLFPLSSIVRPGQKDMIGLIVTARVKLNLNELGHVFELYLVD